MGTESIVLPLQSAHETYKVPEEFDINPSGLGFTMQGWDFSRQHIEEAIHSHRMLNPAVELGTNICPWNCEFCFTESPDNPDGRKRRLQHELSISDRLRLIDSLAALGAETINFVGAGEPTIDPHFWTLIERMRERSITPIIYTEASLKLTQRDFVKRLMAFGVTVVVKVNSLHNAEYQNAIVRGRGGISQSENYLRDRNRAIELLLEEGFASVSTTRLAFDTIICKQNFEEITTIHRYARRRNIFVLFVNYLPSGRSSSGLYDALSEEEQFKLFTELAEIDRHEFGISHRSIFPYAGGVPCSIRGLGLFIKITGSVFDCPGEMIPLGNLRDTPIEEIWARAQPITRAFDGECAPRNDFWKRRDVRRLPLLEDPSK